MGPTAATQGSGPYSEEEFDLFLDACGINIRTIAAEDDWPPRVVVLGREAWNERDVDELQEASWSEDIRIYSQEMVIASMAIGRDIYELDEDGLLISEEFVPGHPALEYFHADGPMGPGQPLALNNQQVETLHVDFAAETERPPVGILGDMGYRVGKVRGLPRQERREILWRTFRVHLTAVSPWTQAYINEWGPRCSSARLSKMCNVLTSLIITAKQTTTRDMSVAIEDWSEDLQFLQETRSQWLTHNH